MKRVDKKRYSLTGILIGMVLAVFFILLVLYILTRPDMVEEQKPAPNLNDINLSVGDTVTKGDIEVTPIRVTQMDSSIALQPLEGKLVKITYKMKNRGFEQALFVTEDFTTEANEVVIKPYWQTADGDSAFSVFLNEGDEATAYTYYDLPEAEYYYINLHARPLAEDVKARWRFTDDDIEEEEL